MKAYTRQSKLCSWEPECEKAAARESILDRIPSYDTMARHDYELFSLYGTHIKIQGGLVRDRVPHSHRIWLAIKQAGRPLFAAVFQQVAERIGAGTLEHGAESYVVADTGSEAATIFFSKGPYERVAALPPDFAIGMRQRLSRPV